MTPTQQDHRQPTLDLNPGPKPQGKPQGKTPDQKPGEQNRQNNRQPHTHTQAHTPPNGAHKRPYRAARTLADRILDPDPAQEHADPGPRPARCRVAKCATATAAPRFWPYRGRWICWHCGENQ